MLTDYLEGQESVDYSDNKFIAHVTSLRSLIKGPDISLSNDTSGGNEE